jgi:hypothetical protein
MRKLTAMLVMIFVLGALGGIGSSQAQTPGTTAAAAPAPDATKATMIDPNGMLLAIGSLIVIGAAAFVMGRKSDMLRDSEPTDFGGAQPAPNAQYRRPYSLAQTQMAWWFGIILAAFLYAVFANPAHKVEGILNDTALILMGIGSGTAIGAAVVEQSKGDKPSTLSQFKATVAALKQVPAGTTPPPALIAARDELAKKVASENLIKDLLTDADGVGLHRFQSVVWTFVLGVMFLVMTITSANFAFPIFDERLLAVLGISGGVYLGFKIPEKPS